MKNTKFFIVAILLFVWLFPNISFLKAEEYSSTNFILRDPVITVEGGRSSSTTFEYFSSTGQIAPGESTSTSFIGRGGFLFFAIATSPVVTATAGDGQVSLTWTASSATLANITNYQVGTATVSGGPYTYVSVGNVLSSTRTGLTNGTTYYFRVRAFAGGLRLAESLEASATPVAPAPPPSGGGGGGAAPPPVPLGASVILKGKAYPLLGVNVLKDGTLAVTTIADPQANFSIQISNISAGTYTFGLWGEDRDGNKSITFSFTTSLSAGITTTIGGIFLPPTISADKTSVAKGGNINFVGQTAPQSEVSVHISSAHEIVKKLNADTSGLWSLAFNTTPLEEGAHTSKSKATSPDGLLSSLSKVISFVVGRPALVGERPGARGRLNDDDKVNLIDFSIMLFHWQSANARADQNGDGIVNIIDFSILLFWWTG